MTVEEAAAHEVAVRNEQIVAETHQLMADPEMQDAFALRLKVVLDAARQVVADVMQTEKVTRFEVIDHTTEAGGRLLVRYGVKVEAAFQDQGRTMKVFLSDPPDPDSTLSANGFRYKIVDEL